MKLIRADWMVIVAIVFFLGAHVTTNIIMGIRQDVASDIQASQKAVEIAEANPIAKLFINVRGVHYMFTYVLMPAMLLAFYWFVRNKYRYDEVMLELFGVFFLFSGFTDALNDISILIGMMV